MSFLNILLGIALVTLGVWQVIVRLKNIAEDKADTLGGNSGLLIIGIGLIVCGIIEIVKHI